MKTLNKILTAVFTLTAFAASAQDDVKNVKTIVDAVTVNCGAPAWGKDSLKAIENYSLYR